MCLHSLTLSSHLFIVKGFPVLTSGLHCSIPGPQAIYLLTRFPEKCPPQLATSRFLISLYSVQPVRPLALKSTSSNISCFSALHIHLTHTIGPKPRILLIPLASSSALTMMLQSISPVKNPVRTRSL
ncbi:hypothetical protein ILYODFUR_033080 [Ilyodon furcidens]|uniref:Uncharacterized protein n=1 Tax=Ilyodon furcidens TaxID=33524 RepID=A0ABV0U2N4_9TELE